MTRTPCAPATLTRVRVRSCDKVTDSDGVAGPLSAHDFWIEPASYRPAPGTPVALKLRVGALLAGEPLPRIPQLIERFNLVSASGESAVPGKDMGDPAGSVSLPSPGLYIALYESRFFTTEVEGAKFESYVVDEGLDAVGKERAKRGETGQPTRERFSRCAKAFLLVGSDPKVGASVDKPLGCPLEIFPDKNPYAMKAGEELPVHVVLRGKPAADILVAALDPASAQNPIKVRADKQGRAKLKLPRAGFWLIKAVHAERAPEDTDVSWQSWWASMTFELPAK